MSEGDEYLVVPAVEGLVVPAVEGLVVPAVEGLVVCLPPSGPRGRSTGRVVAAVKGLDFRLGREDMLDRV